MIKNVRSLNLSGVEVFRVWLSDPMTTPPIHILDDIDYSEELEVEYLIDTSKLFETSFELGKYLHECVFKDVKDSKSLGMATGIWAWISLTMIHSLLAKSAKRKGKPLDSAHYIELEGNVGRRLGYRLIARTSWKLVRLHGAAAEVALGSRRSPWGEMAEQMTSRQEIFSHPSFWAVATKLYMNEDGDIRRGATSQRPLAARKDPKNTAGRGGVRRLPLTFRQFDRTYHTRNMHVEKMLAVLPAEYSKWLP